jgi:bifunctional hydroxylase/dehydrase
VDDFDADVVVVGAGPTGLMLAGELRLAGVSVLVLERLTVPVPHSKALGFSARAIEEFDQRGLLSRFGDVQTIPVGHFGGLPLDFRVIERGSYGARGIPQSRTEAILAEWAGGLGARVLRQHDVTGLTQDADGVRLTVCTPDGRRTFTARYVVGCDGGHSNVRSLAGIGFPGTDPAIEMWLADVTDIDLRPRFSGERVPGGMIMVLPAGPNVWRLGIYERDAPVRDNGTMPSFDEVTAAWQRLTGDDISSARPLWISRFTDASRIADRYRVGRVLVAGDAAHVHLPQGGQGMSAGIGDAMNLGWKLATVLHGHADDDLLDTYHTERHPVAERIIANTLSQRILYLSDESLDPLRELFDELLQHETVRRHLAGMVSGLDIRYDVGGPAHPLLGVRLPDHGLAGRSTAFECLHHGRPVVIDYSDDEAVRLAAGPWRHRVDVVTARADAEPWMRLDDVDALLVRPDGYVAWLSTGGNGAAGLADALARWFGPATTQPQRKESTMPVISPDSGYLTVLNIFRTDSPEKQERLIGAMRQIVDNAAYEGWISSTVHSGEDKIGTANFIQWRKRDDLERRYASDEFRHQIPLFAELTTTIKLLQTEVVYTQQASDEQTRIDPGRADYTVIEVMHVGQENLDELVGALGKGQEYLADVPGYRSHSVLKGKALRGKLAQPMDGAFAVVYSQWDSKEAFDAHHTQRERHQPEQRRRTQAVIDAVVTDVEWNTYRVAHTRANPAA